MLQGDVADMFVPGYATILRLIDGETMAKKCGLQPSDVIVAVNGIGFRRFALAGYTPEEGEEDKYRVLKNVEKGEGYSALMSKIKSVKAAADPEAPLVLNLERYGWDEQPNSWERFLKARNGDVPTALQMQQAHESWRATTFPINLSDGAIQDILKTKAVSELDIGMDGFPPCVYVDYAKLQALSYDAVDSVVTSFVLMTETILKKSSDPKKPTASQFIDLSDVSITGGMRSDILRKIYGVFEPNYPETLHRMVMYPVSRLMAKASRAVLSFVNENTAAKFVITDSIDVVCKELGWSKDEIDAAGGVSQYLAEHKRPCEKLLVDE